MSVSRLAIRARPDVLGCLVVRHGNIPVICIAAQVVEQGLNVGIVAVQPDQVVVQPTPIRLVLLSRVTSHHDITVPNPVGVMR